MLSIPINPFELTSISPCLPFSFPPMKDVSLFLLKNSLASEMKKGTRSFCNDVGSTSTLNQSKIDANVSCVAASLLSSSSMEESNFNASPKTLEEMLLQLDLEEAAARRAKPGDYGELNRRMSCVNKSDILRSARNALNQYPRFSLDGRDAMYRNFGCLEGGRKSVCSDGLRGVSPKDGYELDMERSLRLPPKVAGECVVWCKPSVVAKLMGLDAVPVPVPGRSQQGRRRSSPKQISAAGRNRNLRVGRYVLEDRNGMSMGGYK